VRYAGYPDPAAAEEPKAISVRPVANRDYMPVLLESLRTARSSVKVAHFEFHPDETTEIIAKAMGSAAKRGVSVRVLIESSLDFNKEGLLMLEQEKINAKLDNPSKILHTKLVVIDKKKVLIGSTNFSGNSLNNNNEVNVCISGGRIGAFFSDYFESLWRGESANANPSPTSATVRGVTPFTDRKHMSVIKKTIDSSTNRLCLIMYGTRYYSEQPDSPSTRLVDSLATAAQRGVDVHVILEKSDYNSTLNRLNRETARRLLKGGVVVRFDRQSVTTHAKMLIADDKVIIGSANWGYQALMQRHEASVLIDHPRLAQYFKGYFTTIWKRSRPADPASGP
jgi:phosphatidylserine/phosphatidylglycerophosphate/cardiolipin synthase-like enzyme